MDRLTPAPSFRPTRSMTRTARQRPSRPRHLSPSPRPGMRRTFSEASSAAVYITTDCDHELDLDLIPTSSPASDADLVFHMSPVHSAAHHFGRSSPPLSPLLYSFPRPSHTHGYAKQERTHDSHQNVPRRTYPISSARGLEPRPLAASLVDTTSRHSPKSFTPPSTPTRLHISHVPSAPIPIPRSKSRRVDPNQSVLRRPPPSIIGSSGDMLPSRFSEHSMASPLCSVEGFGELESDDDADADADAEESATDSRSLATPSTAFSYSYEAPCPLHATKFLDDK